MVKLSYAGRKVQGLKLGQAVARDLRKRIPPGSGARAAARDPTIELDLTGKLLTDDGLKEIIDALVSCIKFQDENYPNGVIKLTELSLKGNALTTTAIARLAKVVELSKSSLVKLDISDNGISIISKTQRSNWRIFLKSFEECYMLKSIDFSGNKLGSAGFDGISEVFLKSELYFIVPSPARIPDENGKLHSVGDKLKSISLNTNGNDTLRLPAAGEANCRRGAAEPKNDELYASTRGLRSVPYLNFAGSGNTTACAFHLWGMSMVHLGAEELLEFLPTGRSMVPPGAVQHGSGIVYVPNEFGPLGRSLLATGEQFVRELSRVDDDIDSMTLGEDLDRDEVVKARHTCKRTQEEMERIKYRAILDVLTTEGVQSVELWNVAFKTMIVARALLLDDGDKQGLTKESNVTDKMDKPGHNDDSRGSPEQALGRCYPQSNSPWTDFAQEFPSLPTSPRKRNDGPVKNGITSQSTSKKDNRGFKAGSGHLRSRACPCAEMLEMSPQAISRPAPGAVFKQVGRFGLPMRLWTRIIVEAMDENEVLNPQQQMRIIRYACDWNSVTQELKIKGGTEAEQIRKILNSMDCLSYSKFD
ncbi:hypothetical protein D8B26_001541 [Coccidioides posadasii str. Silveira]|uniref:uncharacterized protein n=1 Tax=Coccidioides posadasii (strain RMSCC 757 / Silveira) TaxID=443226 RepID=UPI001BEE5381|nr:hypothetical protein D8B26_001541 [Coccidioides posadasii str. Silveira]